MRYECRIEIDLPREEVTALFDNPENRKEWQPGLLSCEHLSGAPGTPGATSRLSYRTGKGQLDMIETLVKRDLPNAVYATYEVGQVWNKIENVFEELSPGRTLWTARNEFRCRGYMRLMAFLAPTTFSKQSEAYMLNFKAFAERRAAEG